MLYQPPTKKTSKSNLNAFKQPVLWQELTNNQQEAIQGGTFDVFTKVVQKEDNLISQHGYFFVILH
ncbi:hypothetical protein NIES2119_06340 [[Phormidium ambiguum] IAM M-71]|uniref:Uncharacterized protein n=1 Tax=[Phormidium ambiguum] IAM M-71 TaxID=454136 RepID=A0A1U7IPL7_9CYAN|nr:hypothetical protein [Phormidium ambiguum]OKH39356.1 hypothetical protein NIES2119_06340 [Phormidium ambiguum IAM M-71]